MERGDEKGHGSLVGGIVSLKKFINEHREAVEADLITSAGIELKEVGRSLSWGALASFLSNLDLDSAVWRSANPDLSDWATTLKTNIILADIYDVLSQINSNICGGFARKKPQRIKPYPRPWLEKKKQKIGGKGALPKKELREWIYNYRRK